MAFPGYVDISSFQPTAVNWAAYVLWSKSVDGIARLAVRASEGTVPATPGTNVGDTHYAAYVSGIRAVDPNAIVIHYHYAYPQFNSPQSEVDWMATQVSRVGLAPQDVIMLDFEENVTSGTNDTWALAWLEAAKAKFGRTPVIYASLSMVQNRLQNSRLAEFPLILADWTGGTTPPATPAPWAHMWAWQYTDSLAGVPGFGSANVDANFFLHTGSTPPPPPKLVTNHGAVLDLRKSYQLDGGSQDKCGPWTASELRFAGLPGHGARGTTVDVAEWAGAEYTRWIGPDVPSDQQGSSIDNMHEFFTDSTDPEGGQRNLHWHDIPAINPSSNRADDNRRVIRALDAGYPVAVTVNEQSVKRPDGSNPYPWQPGLGPVNHVFTIVGHTSDGFFLVDDELNLNDTWPDKYSQSALELHWASVIQVVGPDPAHPWLLPIPNTDDPLQYPAGFVAQTFGFGGSVGVPTGWKLSADGATLTAPNGVSVHTGFKDEVITASPQWDPANEPQTPEYHVDQVLLHRTDLGAGQVQPFRDDYLWFTTAKGVVREKELGLEIWLREQKLQALSANLSSVQAQLASVQAQLAAGGGVPADLQAAVNQAFTNLQSAAAGVAALQPFVK